MSVTLKKVAEKAGLSVPTVSQVLNNQRGELFRPETRRRVLRAAESLGYTVNSSARAVRTGRFGAVALLQSPLPDRSVLFAELLVGLEDGLEAHNLHLIVARMADEQLNEEQSLPKLLRESLSDGLLINYHTNTPAALERTVRQQRIPAIWINRQREHDAIRPDDREAGARAARLLLEHGHRHIAYVDYANYSTVQNHYSVDARYEGYRQVMEEAGLSPRRIQLASPLPPEDRAAYTAGWLSAEGRPTAVICYGGSTTESVLYAMVGFLGKVVPRDLSIVTFNTDACRACEYSLAMDTFVLPERQIGHEAVGMLMEKIADPDTPLPEKVLPFVWYRGRSVAPPPAEVA